MEDKALLPFGEFVGSLLFPVAVIVLVIILVLVPHCRSLNPSVFVFELTECCLSRRRGLSYSLSQVYEEIVPQKLETGRYGGIAF